MNRCLIFIGLILLNGIPARSQNISISAMAFMQSLTQLQQGKTLYAFDTTERFRFNYIPQDDRKGIAVNDLNVNQRNSLITLLNTCVTEETVEKITAIMQLDNVLKEIEHRQPEDHYRDTGKYFVTIFGVPGLKTIWGWRFEGHHVAFHFTIKNNKLVAGTPGFLGCNPGIVQTGLQKEKAVLKKETAMGFALLHALNTTELKLALIDSIAPNEIITRANRQANIDHSTGVNYRQLIPAHQQQLVQLLHFYLLRYSKPFAAIMLKEIEAAGLNNLWFTWAGFTEPAIGKPCYYRIQGPTIIIEYDNSQNNANHIHTVIRDLKNDFGGDLLLEHYRKDHQNKS